MEVRSPRALIIPAPATLHKIHLVLNGLREATHAARSIIMQGWNGPLGSYLHLSVFPATSNLLMIIKEQRGPAAPWKQAPASREWPCIHNHPELKPLFDKNQEKLAGRLPRTTCKPPATPGWDGYSKYSEQHAVISKYCFVVAQILGDQRDNKRQKRATTKQQLFWQQLRREDVLFELS